MYLQCLISYKYHLMRSQPGNLYDGFIQLRLLSDRASYRVAALPATSQQENIFAVVRRKTRLSVCPQSCVTSMIHHCCFNHFGQSSTVRSLQCCCQTSGQFTGSSHTCVTQYNILFFAKTIAKSRGFHCAFRHS